MIAGARTRGGLAALLLSVWAPSAAYAQVEFKVADRNVQVHGFLSQGFVSTDGNNWLTMETNGGSAAMTETGLNISSLISKKFRVGAQVYARNLGQLGEGHPSLDWAFGDYRFTSWFGVRAGKVKTTLGLYTDTQDLDFIHAFALMPQSVYPLDLRDANISHLGGDVYGNVPLPNGAGSLDYTAYVGHRDDSLYSAYPFFLAARGTTQSTYRGIQYGADLRWNTPVDGLIVGASRLNEELKGRGVRLGLTNQEKTKGRNDWTNQFYAQYVWRNLRSDAEYKQFNRDHLIRNYTAEDLAKVHAWYVAGSYRVMRQLEVGAYYSHYTITSTYLGLQDTSLPAGHDYDKVVSIGVDISRFVNLKAEGHFMDGYGFGPYPNGFYPQLNPNGFAPDTRALVIKSSFNF